MGMVASAKLRKNQEYLESAQAFGASFEGVIPEPEADSVSSILNVPFTTDKGLCGGVNTNVLRIVKEDLAEADKAGKDISLMIVGGKGKGSLQRVYGNKFVGTVSSIGKGEPATFGEACEIARHVGSFEFDEGVLTYNKFKNIVSYNTVKESTPSPAYFASKASEKFRGYELEGDELNIFENLYEFAIATKTYAVMHNSQTCEQSSRMTAMDNSTSSATEMYDKLLLQANRMRQAKITKELMEVVSGAAAVEDG
jgi:F-type H+-transporting ATPase subunit gamma